MVTLQFNSARLIGVCMAGSQYNSYAFKCVLGRPESHRDGVYMKKPPRLHGHTQYVVYIQKARRLHMGGEGVDDWEGGVNEG